MDISESDSTHVNIGCIAERDLINLLKTFNCIESVEKDHHNSKFDLYYKLKGESWKRGLQVKAITKIKYSEDYRMNHLDRYSNGMLIVGINLQEKLGLAYLKSQKYDVSTARISTNPKSEGIFSKLLLPWEIFLIHLQNLLFSGVVITQDTFENSMTETTFKEYSSLERFFILCKKCGFEYKRVFNNASKTDLILEGLRVQLKFSAAQTCPTKRTYSHKVSLSTSEGPYRKGDNDLYIVELGSNQGDFLFLPEDLLIEKGYIKTFSQPGRTNLDVYPYDYVQKRKLITPKCHHNKITGNWTCDKSLWISTQYGPLKDIDI